MVRTKGIFSFRNQCSIVLRYNDFELRKLNPYKQHIADEQLFSLTEGLNIKRVSPSLIKKVKGYDNLSDQEIEQVIESIYKLSILTLYLSNS